MGALGFLGGFGSAATRAAGQGQEQRIDDILKIAQLREQLQTDPLRMALMQQQLATGSKQLIKNPDDSYSIVDLANPTAAPTTIGQRRNYGSELKALQDSGNIPTGLSKAVDAAIKSNDPKLQQDVYDSTLKVLSAPSYQKTNLTPDEKAEALQQYLSSGTLPPLAARAVSSALASKNPAMIESVYNKVIPPVFGAGAYGMRMVPYSYTDPSGATVTMPLTMPARGGAASPVYPSGSAPSSVMTPTSDPSAAPPAFTAPSSPFGGGPLISRKLGQKEDALVATVQTLIPQLEDLKRRFQEIGPDRWNKARTGYVGVRYGKVGLADKQAQELMQKAIQVEGQAKAAIAASAGTRANAFIKSTEGHVPSGWGDYDYNMGAIDTLLDPNGPYKSTLNLYHFPARGPVSSGTSADLPPASMIPEGHKRSFSNGKTYQNIGGTVSEASP